MVAWHMEEVRIPVSSDRFNVYTSSFLFMRIVTFSSCTALDYLGILRYTFKALGVL